MDTILAWFRRSRTPRIVLHAEIEREDDGRWIVDVTDLPGVMVYGASQQEAMQHALALTLRVLADRIERGELPTPQDHRVSVDFELQYA